MTPARPPVFCLLKQKLKKACAQAVSEHNRIQSPHVAAVTHGDGEQFIGELEDARTQMEHAKAAVLAHRQEHGLLGVVAATSQKAANAGLCRSLTPLGESPQYPQLPPAHGLVQIV